MLKECQAQERDISAVEEAPRSKQGAQPPQAKPVPTSKSKAIRNPKDNRH